MAHGSIHARDTLLVAAPVAATVCAAAGFDAGIVAGLGCLAGIVATPDLDQITIAKNEWAIVRRVPVLGWQWMAWWDLYARCIPHRHWLSHAPIVGTLGRLAYFLGVWVAVHLLLKRPLAEWPFLHWPMGWVAWFVAGLGVSDALHWWRDLRS